MGNWNTKARWTRSERNGIIVLLLLMILLTVFKDPIAFFWVKEKEPVTNTAYAGLIQQIEAAKPDYSGYNEKKVWPENKKGSGFSSGYHEKFQDKKWTIEINSASAADFEKLYGIGKVLSERIVKFRNGLGGFQRLDQVNDVYGIEDSTFEKIRKHLTIKPSAVKKININEADLEALSKNPYIAPTLAKQFIGYRTKVKTFDDVEEIKKLYYLRDHPEVYEKLSPYLTVN